MAKKGRVSRPKGDLKKELGDQIALMKVSCEVYDNGLNIVDP